VELTPWAKPSNAAHLNSELHNRGNALPTKPHAASEKPRSVGRVKSKPGKPLAYHLRNRVEQ
jgi:hypothetical protein